MAAQCLFSTAAIAAVLLVACQTILAQQSSVIYPNLISNYNAVSCQCVMAPCDCTVSSSSSSSGSSSTSSSSSSNIFTVGRYVIRSTKSGTCPAASALLYNTQCRPGCSSDSNCPGTQKCCGYGGCPTCLAASVPLSSGSKQGTCPAATAGSSGQFGICSNQCNSDQSCPGSQKCCSTSCGGRSCQAPASSAPGNWNSNPAPQYNAGTCPASPSGMAGACVWTASSCLSQNGDADCGSQQKCCSNGCGFSCMNSAVSAPSGTVGNPGSGVKVGTCPGLAANAVGICLSGCSTSNGDSQCPGAQKCCSNGCGNVCMDPASFSNSIPTIRSAIPAVPMRPSSNAFA